ncbi:MULTISPECIES: hypothetical protein [Serratia]|nr:MULTISPECIES: hypothetical protein [Serratia]MBF8219525.1 hypothetical protein [Serratia ureilytica]EJD6704954.1 hypothetical protein [Serratia marcescens]ELH4209035.1 hypothetical protein [Serratia marcescens]EME1465732.1 hypothetical protein [Serratia marcescens]MBF4654300.1 hypothetical protein [Serratia marcescens]
MPRTPFFLAFFFTFP